MEVDVALWAWEFWSFKCLLKPYDDVMWNRHLPIWSAPLFMVFKHLVVWLEGFMTHHLRLEHGLDDLAYSLECTTSWGIYSWDDATLHMFLCHFLRVPTHMEDFYLGMMIAHAIWGWCCLAHIPMHLDEDVHFFLCIFGFPSPWDHPHVSCWLIPCIYIEDIHYYIMENIPILHTCRHTSRRVLFHLLFLEPRLGLSSS
jgi:hypothetical protein